MASQSPMNSNNINPSAQPPIAGATPPGTNALPPEKIVQFRVMRLYKPSLYMSPNLPALTADAVSSRSDLLSAEQQNADFIISPYILLPDSFGDIYLGETFSAYIAIVTGIQEVPLHNVNLSVRLQTTSTSYDLMDTRSIEGIQSGVSKQLAPYESLDMVINHKLNELGTHTLRATVQFMMTKTSEVTTVRKFYRFNVLQPFEIISTYIESNDRILVQCRIINTSKAQLNALEMKFVSTIPEVQVFDIRGLVSNNEDASPLPPANDKDLISKYYAYEIQILNPGESYMYGFVLSLPIAARFPGRVPRSMGYPELRWSSSMGESGILRGDDPQPAPSYLNQINSNLNLSDPNTVKITCLSYPMQGRVDEAFEIVIRITNQTKQNLSLLLTYMNNTEASNNHQIDDVYDDALTVIGLSNMQLGIIHAGAYMERNLTIFPSRTGLLEMRDIALVDIYTGREYFSGSLFKIMIDEDVR